MLRAPVPELCRRVRYTTGRHTIAARDFMGRSSLSEELSKSQTAKALEILKHILELELAGLVRSLHYGFMIFGHTRIPIVAWGRSQADESQVHAVKAGEHIPTFGGQP